MLHSARCPRSSAPVSVAPCTGRETDVQVAGLSPYLQGSGGRGVARWLSGAWLPVQPTSTLCPVPVIPPCEGVLCKLRLCEKLLEVFLVRLKCDSA